MKSILKSVAPGARMREGLDGEPMQLKLAVTPPVKRLLVAWVPVVGGLVAAACGHSPRSFAGAGDSTSEVTTQVCEKGAPGCPCYKNLSCDQGLTCSGNRCLEGGEPDPVLQPTSPAVPEGELPSEDDDQTMPPASNSAATEDGASGPWVLRSSCTNTNYKGLNRDNSLTDFYAVTAIYAYGDGATSACLDNETYPKTLCVEGNGVDSGEDFAMWGFGVGLQLVDTELVDGVWHAIAPFDAADRGIAAVRFKVSDLSGRPLRLQLTQVNDPAISDASLNYENNGFVWGGSAPKAATEGANVVALRDFELAEWTEENIASGLGAPLDDRDKVLDSSRLHSLQFQVVNQPGDVVERYSFCISDVQWLDSRGFVVNPEGPLPSPSVGPDAGTASPAAPTTTVAPPTSGTSAPGQSSTSNEGASACQPGETSDCGDASNNLEEGAIINLEAR